MQFVPKAMLFLLLLNATTLMQGMQRARQAIQQRISAVNPTQPDLAVASVQFSLALKEFFEQYSAAGYNTIGISTEVPKKYKEYIDQFLALVELGIAIGKRKVDIAQMNKLKLDIDKLKADANKIDELNAAVLQLNKLKKNIATWLIQGVLWPLYSTESPEEEAEIATWTIATKRAWQTIDSVLMAIALILDVDDAQVATPEGEAPLLAVLMLEGTQPVNRFFIAYSLFEHGKKDAHFDWRHAVRKFLDFTVIVEKTERAPVMHGDVGENDLKCFLDAMYDLATAYPKKADLKEFFDYLLDSMENLETQKKELGTTGNIGLPGEKAQKYMLATYIDHLIGKASSGARNLLKNILNSLKPMVKKPITDAAAKKAMTDLASALDALVA